MNRPIAAATTATLGGIAALHVAWGLGSSFPFLTRHELADAVVGSQGVPSPGACFAVAGALAAACVVVADAPIASRQIRAVGRCVLAGVLTVRGASGLAGRTDSLVPGAESPRFRRLDRTVYAPLCLALAAGVLAAARESGVSRVSRGGRRR